MLGHRRITSLPDHRPRRGEAEKRPDKPHLLLRVSFQVFPPEAQARLGLRELKVKDGSRAFRPVGAQVRFAEEQHPVQEFAAQGVGELFAGCAYARSLGGGPHDCGGG